MSSRNERYSIRLRYSGLLHHVMFWLYTVSVERAASIFKVKFNPEDHNLKSHGRDNLKSKVRHPVVYNDRLNVSMLITENLNKY